MLTTLLLLGLACVVSCRDWAKVPPNFFGVPSCADITPVVDICDRAISFDDVVVFDIDSVVEVNSPVFAQSGENLGDGSTSECRLIAAGTALVGGTESSALGATPSRLVIPGDTVELQRDELLPGTKILVPISFAEDGVSVPAFWIQVDDDVVTRMPPPGCAERDGTLGVRYDAVIASVRECSSVGSDFVPLDGAICFPPE